jgi:hypothetical protein
MHPIFYRSTAHKEGHRAKIDRNFLKRKDNDLAATVQRSRPVAVLFQLPYFDNCKLGYLLQLAAAVQFDMEFNIGEILGDVHTVASRPKAHRVSPVTSITHWLYCSEVDKAITSLAIVHFAK